MLLKYRGNACLGLAVANNPKSDSCKECEQLALCTQVSRFKLLKVCDEFISGFEDTCVPDAEIASMQIISRALESFGNDSLVDVSTRSELAELAYEPFCDFRTLEIDNNG